MILCLLLAALPGPDPVHLAETLMEGLALPLRGPPPGATIAIGLPEGAHGVSADALAGALVTRLEGAGYSSGGRARSPEAARRAGAEWWLALEEAPGGLSATLFEIDRGPFRPLPSPLPVVAFARAATGETGATPSIHGDPGGPAMMLEWPEPVEALAWCQDQLWLVLPHGVAVLDSAGRTLAALPVTDVADEPSRARIAAAHCGPAGDVAMGSGRWAEGIVARLEEGSLEVRSRHGGLPVGFLDRWWWADAVPGRPLLARFGPGSIRHQLERPVHALARAEAEWWAVDTNLDLRRVSDEGSFATRVGVSGDALACHQDWCAASAADEHPSVTVRRGSANLRFGLPEAVSALGFGTLDGRRVLFVATRRGAGAQIWHSPPLEFAP